MNQSSPLLSFSDTILWLKVVLSAAALVLLYVRYRKRRALGASAQAYSLRTKVAIGLAILFSFSVFHNLGSFRGGSFVHYGEMFHYYLGPKYFKEVGYYELYNAVIVADTEQGNALAGLPFYTDLRTYQNTPRAAALNDIDRVKGLFSKTRWDEFKQDVAFFKNATGLPKSTRFLFILMDHGYNASPVSTFLLSLLTNAVPVTRLGFLAAIDVFLVAAMIALVFRSFGFEIGALFSVYFFVNILNDHEYISGSLLRYDWLLYIVAAVCLLKKERHAASAFFLTLAAMLKIFPAVLFCGVGVAFLRKAKEARAVDKKFVRFVVAAGVTALGLFLLPAVQLGSVVQPWKDFSAKTALHNGGVYVNHIGLRGIALFEPSHLSLDEFAKKFKSNYTNDIVRHWQDVKENEFRQKEPVIVFCSLVVLLCVSVIIWKRKEHESESVLWPLMFIYAISYASHYYYAFLCLFVLLFFRRTSPLDAMVPLCLLLVFNIAALVTDSFRPSPIVGFTLINIELFVCLSSILGFELYATVFRKIPVEAAAGSPPPREARRDAKKRRR